MGKIKKSLVGLGAAAVVATGVIAFNSGENNSIVQSQDKSKVVNTVSHKPAVAHKPIVVDKKVVSHKPVVTHKPLVTHKPVVTHKPIVVHKKVVSHKPVVKVNANLGGNVYKLDLNSDGEVDIISLENNGKISSVKDGLTGVISKLSTDMVRNDLFQVFRYSSNPRVENGSIPSSYLITQNGGDEELVKYLVATNNVSGIKTKLTNALEVTTIVDKVANSYVRGQYLRSHLIDEIKRDPSLLVKKVEDKKENKFTSYIDSLSQKSSSGLSKPKSSKLHGNKLVHRNMIPKDKRAKHTIGAVLKDKKGNIVSGHYVSKPTINIGKYVSENKEHKRIPTQKPTGKGLESMLQGELASTSTYQQVAYKIKDNAKARAIYSGSFGDDVKIQDLVLAMGAGSAILTAIRSDYLPSVQADAALSKSRGANMNTYVMKINDGGRNGLLGSAIATLKGFKEMYQKQIEATTTQINKLEKF